MSVKIGKNNRVLQELKSHIWGTIEPF